jgi:hypothetical protein
MRKRKIMKTSKRWFVVDRTRSPNFPGYWVVKDVKTAGVVFREMNQCFATKRDAELRCAELNREEVA